MNQVKDWLAAREAAELLGIKLETLYAYASRGLVGSAPGPRGRTRQYRRADLERLRARRQARSGHGPTAGGALRFGEPVLDSSITHIRESGPSYRGVSAVALASEDTSFERVAELLWTGSLPEAEPEWPRDGFGAELAPLARLLPDTAAPLDALALAVPAIAAGDPGRFDPRPEAALPRARSLIPRLAAGLGIADGPERVERALASHGVARTLAVGLGVRPRTAAVRALDRALVLIADHELNASAFAARIAASAGADLYAATAAALGTLSGPHHGGAVERCEALIVEAGRPENAQRVIADRTRRGSRVPGFGHPLYPDGDPRVHPLLDAARGLAPSSRRVGAAFAMIDAMQDVRSIAPNVDFALATLGAALGLHAGAVVGVFAVGRAAGWTAHIAEQYEAGFLLRPRARYVGT